MSEIVYFCKCGRASSEYMGMYSVSDYDKTAPLAEFTCCLCSAGIDENSIEAEMIYGSGRGRLLPPYSELSEGSVL
uniref:Uncharacterized protein n=1 Tax=viral metagenome TaxID=1070528 RepID=A0A6M3KK54_9ZZZZ